MGDFTEKDPILSGHRSSNREVMGNFNQFLKVMGGLLFVLTIFISMPTSPSIVFDIPNTLVRIGGFCLLGLFSLFMGALLGLIFGVPRSNRRNSSLVNSKDNYGVRAMLPYGGNSNLEEISDWLTKMIVGIALINWKDIVVVISSLVRKLEASLGGDFFGIMALGLIGAYFGIGFAMGYVWSRVFLPRLLSEAEQVESSSRDRI